MAIAETHGVYKDFVQGDETIHALKPTNFAAEPGQFIALIGPSGSGKSTLLTLLGGLQAPTGGSVFVDGKDLASMDDKERSGTRLRSIGFILQSANLVPFLTVNQQLELHDRAAENRGARQKDRDELLDSLGILKLAKKYPRELSGGEQQRAAIARALYGSPALILADEPTAALDTSRAFDVADLLREQARSRNTAIIMVTHDERLVEHVDRVLHIADGALEEVTGGR
ncbi:ABC transporter ATP-binding protein [Changpingibacter yushuensis]|uniref:ABC transporter ATP-binding protein n=1 Tax=Changpingibacter yushuensis TaxID=2758440 RepID=UPI00165D80B2|nr:ABC transporter ATP-binding protein [Changpingibacter yushuensis]